MSLARTNEIKFSPGKSFEDVLEKGLASGGRRDHIAAS